MAAPSSGENLTRLFFEILSRTLAESVPGEETGTLPRTELTETEKNALNVLTDGFRKRVYGRVVRTTTTTTVGPAKDRAGDDVENRAGTAPSPPDDRRRAYVAGGSRAGTYRDDGPPRNPLKRVGSGNPTGRPAKSTTVDPIVSRFKRVIDLLDRSDGGGGLDEAIGTMMNVRPGSGGGGVDRSIAFDAPCPFDGVVDDRALAESVSTAIKRLHETEN